MVRGPCAFAGGVQIPALKRPAGGFRCGGRADLAIFRENRRGHVLDVRCRRTCSGVKADGRLIRDNGQREGLRIVHFRRSVLVQRAVCNGSGQCNSTGCCIRDRQRLSVFSQRDAIVSAHSPCDGLVGGILRCNRRKAAQIIGFLPHDLAFRNVQLIVIAEFIHALPRIDRVPV